MRTMLIIYIHCYSLSITHLRKRPYMIFRFDEHGFTGREMGQNYFYKCIWTKRLYILLYPFIPFTGHIERDVIMKINVETKKMN